MVLRRETFAGHTLSMMAFPGACGRAARRCARGVGLFRLLRRRRDGDWLRPSAGARRRSWGEQSASVGAVQALALAAGFLFVSLYGGVLGDLENLLFGDLLGISTRRCCCWRSSPW